MKWIATVDAEEGKSFFLDLPEMGAVGQAHVVSVGPTPPLKPGKGAIITGVFEHEADENTRILKVEFSGGVVVHGVTENHLFWSEDRQAFIQVGALREGERVRTGDDTATVVSLSSRPARPGELLNNLEVHGEHVYRVTASGILVHNSCADILTPGGKPIGVPGSSPAIRELPGGAKAAQDMFDELAKGAKDITPPGYPGKLVEVPEGGVVGIRPSSKSGPPTIDVNVPGIPIKKIKFP